MPLKPIGRGGPVAAAPAPAESSSFIDTLKKWAPSVVRGGAGLASALAADVPGPGSFLGGGINALGETVAEGMEGSPLSLKRIAAEGALGMVPMGKIMPAAGTITRAVVGGGAFAGTGEGVREYAKGESLDPSRIGEAALIGGGTAGLFNGILGRFFGTKAPAAVADAPLDVQTTAHTGPGTSETTFGKGGKVASRGPGRPLPRPRDIPRLGEVKPAPTPAPSAPTMARTPYNVPEPPPEPSAPDLKANPVADAANPNATKILMRDQQNESNVARWLEGKRTAAKRVADNAERAKKIDEQILAEKRVPGNTAISKSTSAQTPDGTISARTPYKTPEADGVSKVADLLKPHEGSPAARVDAWIAAGASPEDAIVLANAGQVPPGAAPAPAPSAPPVDALQAHMDRYSAWMKAGASHEEAVAAAKAGKMPPGAAAPQPPPSGPPVPAAAPSAAHSTPAVASEPPSAVFAYHDPTIGQPYYHVQGGPSDRSTVSAAQLAELGIPVPETPPVPEAPSAPVSPAAEAPSSPLARFFKSRLEAAGQGYGDIKAARAAGEADPQEGYLLAGKAARDERVAAGLPAPPRTPAVASAPDYTPADIAGFGQQSNQLDELSALLKAQPVEEPPAIAAEMAPAAAAPVAPPADLAAPESASNLQRIIEGLRKKGFTDEQIGNMTGEEAAGHLNAPEAPTPPEPTATPTKPRLVKKGKRGGSENGAVDQTLLNLMTRAGLGAATGGLVGGMQGHPLAGALLGASAGGLMTPNVAEVIPALSDNIAAGQEGISKYGDLANRLHNTALLSPLSVAKKAAAVPGELITAALTEPDKAGALLRMLTSPHSLGQAVQTGRDAFNAPNQEVISGLENYIQKGPLSLSGRTMGGIVAGAKDILRQSDYSGDAANYYTMSGQPNTRAGQASLQAIRGSKALSHFLPFSKLAINRIERGIDYSPLGPLIAAGKKGVTPEDIQLAIRKALIGSSIGYGAYKLTPEDYAKEHPVATSIIAAAGGPLSIPLGVGMASKTSSKNAAAQAAKTMSRDIPGLETINQLTTDPRALLPNYLSGYTNVARPIALGAEQVGLTPTSDPNVSAKLPWEEEDPNKPTSEFGPFTKMLANLPVIREALPARTQMKLPALPHLRGRR